MTPPQRAVISLVGRFNVELLALALDQIRKEAAHDRPVILGHELAELPTPELSVITAQHAQ